LFPERRWRSTLKPLKWAGNLAGRADEAEAG
jgi:hypothetical protein